MSQPQDPADTGEPQGSDPTNQPDGGSVDSAFVNDAMDDETTYGDPANAGRHSTDAAAAAGGFRFRRPPAWVLSAAAALVIGLVLGLLFFGGDDPAPEQTAQRPSTTSVAPTTREGPITALAHVPPVQLMIPTIGVDTPLVNLGLNGDGTLEVPVNYDRAGWFTGGNYPGDPSGPPGLLAGHVDDYTGPAVFYDLNTLVAGDEIMVLRADNTVAVFVVTGTAQFPKDELPTDEIYAPVPDSQIVLITCTGPFDESVRSYEDNLVVRAALDMGRSLEESNARYLNEVPVPAVDQTNA